MEGGSRECHETSWPAVCAASRPEEPRGETSLLLGHGGCPGEATKESTV